MAEKDKRIRTLSEILNGIKVLKMFAWEGPAASNVQKIRAAGSALTSVAMASFVAATLRFFAFVGVVGAGNASVSRCNADMYGGAAEVKQLRRVGYQMALQGILWQSTPALVAVPRSALVLAELCRELTETGARPGGAGDIRDVHRDGTHPDAEHSAPGTNCRRHLRQRCPVRS